MSNTSTETIAYGLLDEPLHVVSVGGNVVLFALGVQYTLSCNAAEETARRIASITAIARMEQQASNVRKIVSS